jgi:hypothetical protein
VTSIGSEAFASCAGLTSVTIGNAVTSLGESTFSNCSGLTSVTIPDSVTSVGPSAFSGCSGLSSVTIGSSVTSIGDFAFGQCTGLTALLCTLEAPVSVNANVFNIVNQGSCSLTVPNGSVAAYQAAVVWQDFAPITCANPTVSNTTVLSCGSYTWSATGQTYTASGTYTSINGCETKNLILTVTPSTTATTTVSACGSYMWSANNQEYTTSGTYTYISGCHTEQLNLTIACASVVTLKMNIEGYYDASLQAMRPVLANQGVGSSTTDVDVVTIELHDSSSYVTVETTTAMLQTDGTAVATFSSRSGSYYIVVKYRNSIETWSANPVSVGATAYYNFTDSYSKAFGNNMKLLETGVYGFFSGDINQDGFIEASDYAPLLNDNDAAAEGYNATDLNGDGFVEAEDYPILLNNSDDAIELARP